MYGMHVYADELDEAVESDDRFVVAGN